MALCGRAMARSRPQDCSGLKIRESAVKLFGASVRLCLPGTLLTSNLLQVSLDPGLFLWFFVVVFIVHPTHVNEKYHWNVKQ